MRRAPPVFSQAQDARSWAGALDDFQGRRGRPPYPTSLLERRVGLAGEKTYPEEVTSQLHVCTVRVCFLETALFSQPASF